MFELTARSNHSPTVHIEVANSGGHRDQFRYKFYLYCAYYLLLSTECILSHNQTSLRSILFFFAGNKVQFRPANFQSTRKIGNNGNLVCCDDQHHGRRFVMIIKIEAIILCKRFAYNSVKRIQKSPLPIAASPTDSVMPTIVLLNA